MLLTKGFLAVVLAMAGGVEVGAYKFQVVAPKGATVTVTVDGRKAAPNTTHEVGPILGTKTLRYEMTWVLESGERGVTRGTFTVDAGYGTLLTLTVPLDYAAARGPTD